MFKKIFFAAAVAASAVSCAVTSLDKKSYDVRHIEPLIEAVTVPLSAEVSVLRDGNGNPLKADKTYTFYPKVDFTEGYVSEKAIADLRVEAINRAAREYKADLLVGVLTDVVYTAKEGKNKLESLTVRVSGYPAVYTDFKSITPSEEWMMDYYLMKRNGARISKNLHETKTKEKK